MIKIKKKWLRRSLRVIAVVAVLITVFVFFFLEGIVINRLENKLKNSYGETYAISYDDINYSVFFSSLSVELTDVKVKTDTTEANKFESPFIDLDSKSVKLTSISLWSFFIFSEMNVNNISIEDPHFSIARNKKFESDKNSNSMDEELDISKHIKSLKFDEFKIVNGSAVFFKDMTMKDTLFRLKELNFEAHSFESNNENLSELLIIDKYDQLKVESKSFKYNLGKDSYSIHVKELKGELLKGDFELKDIHFKPPSDHLRSGQEYRGDVKVNQLELYGVKHFVGENIHLSADTAIITDTHIDLTKNQALSKQREKTLWMENLLSIKEDFEIKNLKFQNCSLSSEIKKLGGDSDYELNLTNLNGTIKNISTKDASEDLMLKVESNVFETGKLEMTVKFHYDHPKTSNYEGVISNIHLKSFNDLIVKMYPLKIEAGELSSLTFKGETEGDESNGKLTFEYKDLKGSFIKENNGKKKPAKLISKLMNFVINASNPREGENDPEEVSFSFTKEKHHGQISLWLGGIVDGTVRTIIGRKKHDFLVKQME